METALDLRHHRTGTLPQLAPYLHERTAGRIGSLARLIRQAAITALLDGTERITLHGHGTLPATELHLSPAACATSPPSPASHSPTWPSPCPASPPTATLTTPQPPHTGNGSRPSNSRSVPAPCAPVTAVTAVTDTAWVHRPPHRLVCPCHQQAAPDPRLTTTIRTGAAPELTAANHAHQRLLRANTAWATARAITTRWYDQQQHLTHRWHTRLTQLIADSPHLTTTSSASPALLARDLVTYPEPVALARAPATFPNRPDRTTDDALGLITHRLNLTRLTLNANDPLRIVLTHTRH